MSLFPLLGDWPRLQFPAELLAALAGGCTLLLVMYGWLIIRRVLAAHRQDVRQAACLFAIREIAACLQGDDPVDTDNLQAALRSAPIASVVQFLRLHRGPQQALVIAQAEAAGVFDQALRDLGCGVASREIAALKHLQFARAPHIRSAVLKQVMRGATPQLRCEALYSFIAMGSTPPHVALAIWVDGTGPDFTPRHLALFQLIAARLPGVLPHLVEGVSHPQLREQLAAIAAQHCGASGTDSISNCEPLRAPIDVVRQGSSELQTERAA